METPNDYNFSIFKPVNDYSRRNRNIILSIVVIWFVTVFGFQLLLRIIQKPTPEKALTVYESVAGNVLAGQASLEEKQAFAGSLLMVLGKSIKPGDREYLQKVLSVALYDMLPDSSAKANLVARLEPLAEKRAELAAIEESWKNKTIRYNEYEKGVLEAKKEINTLKEGLSAYLEEVSGYIIPQDDKFRHVKLIWLPYELRLSAIREPQPADRGQLDRIMKLYLTHNQSFLTDFKFIGFPFHYFYTAVFLLVLFVVLCILYAYRIEHLHKKFNMEI